MYRYKYCNPFFFFFQDMRNLRFAHKQENHSRRVVYDKLMVVYHFTYAFLCCCSKSGLLLRFLEAGLSGNVAGQK